MVSADMAAFTGIQVTSGLGDARRTERRNRLSPPAWWQAAAGKPAAGPRMAPAQRPRHTRRPGSQSWAARLCQGAADHGVGRDGTRGPSRGLTAKPSTSGPGDRAPARSASILMAPTPSLQNPAPPTPA